LTSNNQPSYGAAASDLHQDLVDIYNDRVLEPLIDALDGELDAIAVRSVERMRRELSTYEHVAPEELVPLVRANLAAAMRVARGLPADVVHANAGRERAEQGVAIEDMLNGWRLALEETREAARAAATELKLSDSVLLQFTDRVLLWADEGMIESAVAHRATELERARREQHERANLVRGVLLGTIGSGEARRRAAAYGLAVPGSYVTFRAAIAGDEEVRRIERRLGGADAAGPRNGLAALLDGDLVGFAQRLPSAIDDVTVGVSPPAPLDELVPAFALASRALATARRLGRSGRQDFDALGVRPAVLDDTQVAASLRAAILEPVDASGSAGATLLDTVARYLGLDRRLDRTAAALHVHVNTVRYRLGRFEELTGRSLADTEDLVETWWALQLRSAGGSAASTKRSTASSASAPANA
jgi:hypothetical protein